MMDEKYRMHFDETISKDIKTFAYETVLSQSRYIFVEKKKGRYFGYCTNCGEEFEIEQVKHKTIKECPKCDCTCQIRLARYSRKYFEDKACFIRYDQSKIDNETLVARAFYVSRDYSGDYRNVKTVFGELARYIFSPKENVMFEKDRWWNYYQDTWYRTDSIHKYNRDSLANLNNFIDWSSLDEATKENRFKYSMYKVMGYRDQYCSMTKYFEFYNKYPIIERLIKIGFIDLVKEKLSGWSLKNCVNWKQKDDIFKFLKLNRAQVKEIVGSKVEITPSFLNLYRKNVKEKWKFNLSELKELEELMYGWYRKNIEDYTTWNKLFRYISKQLTKYNMWDTKKEAISTWIDYLYDCEKLKFDLNDERVLFPKNLFRQHQNFIAQIRYKENEKLNEGFEKEKKRREKFKFEYNGIFSIPASSQNELIEEGKALAHCVGGYAERCSKGETDIIFIRKNDEPNKPFVTMEVRENEVVQVRAFKNRKPTEEVLEFVEEFKKQVLNKLSKKKKRKKAA